MSLSTVGYESIEVNASAYLHQPRVERIADQLHLRISSRSYLPRVDDLQSDWVSHVAAPAFRLLRQRRGGETVASFCTIGTGSGLDALTAVEVFGAKRVGLTDVHEEVVATAVENLRGNLRCPASVTIEAGYGDLLAPLAGHGRGYDVIYENLPNVPITDTEAMAEKRTSSAFVPPRKEPIPAPVRQTMLDLHYLALRQGREYLAKGGSMLSCIGARLPLRTLLELGELAGLESSILTYSWKVQDDFKLIEAYARHQLNGFGPFHYYRADDLQRVFSAVPVADSGVGALRLERELAPMRLDPAKAYDAAGHGERIGHTVVVLESRLRP